MSDDLDSLMGQYSPEIQEIALQARQRVKKIAPPALEKVYLGWRVVNFSLDGKMKGTFLSIGPTKNYVNLYFHQGSDLDDQHGLLIGTGKKMRHVTIRNVKDLTQTKLKALIKTAWKHIQNNG
jgi:hypothetical protein